MSCPSCASNDTRLAESGFFADTYFCLRCHKGFERVSSGIKTTIGVGVATFLFGPIGGAVASAVLGSGDDAGSSDSS